MMFAVVIVLVVGAAALRSTWSPCGHSMLSTITPFGEAGRGHRWGVTATFYALGGLVGGLLTGLLAAVLAAAVAALDLSTDAALAIAAGGALVAATIDLGVTGIRPPFHRRQVNEDWLDQYRPWVYAGGFGVQIGCGLATYIMTASVFLVIGLAALTAHPVAALATCGLFGLTRGIMVVAGGRTRTPDDLRHFMRRFQEIEEPVRLGVVAVVLFAAVVLAAGAAGVAGGAGATLVALLLGAAGWRRDAAASTDATDEVLDAHIVATPDRRTDGDREFVGAAG
jgi:hypothetical protein